MLLLAVMLATSASLGLDVILGAFVAGAIIRMLLPPDHERFLTRLDGIGYGFLIPVFFVVSGMGIDPAVLLEKPGHGAVRVHQHPAAAGRPGVSCCSGTSRSRERLQLGLFSATGLPIIVAVTAVAVDSARCRRRDSRSWSPAGMLTVLALPMLAVGCTGHEPLGARPR